jgi:hypothetical protein
MTIAKYFVGGELEAFIAGSHASTTWTTTAGRYDADFSRGAVTLTSTNSGAAHIRIPLTSAQTTCWTSMQQFRTANQSHINPWMMWLNASGTGTYRVMGVGGTPEQPLLQFQYWSGSAWVAASASTMVVPTNALHKFDVRLEIANSGGVIACYVDGVLLNSMSGDTSFISPDSVNEVWVYTTGGGSDPNTVAISEVQILDVSTLGRRLATLYLTGTGTTDAWTPSTGATSVATMDEAGSYADSDYASSPTANQIYTGVTSDLSTTAQQYAVDSIVIAYRALHGATGPQNLQGVVRTGGTNYPSGVSVASLTTGFGYTWDAFDTNPDTAGAWTPSDINTAGFETGAKSIT